MRQGAELPRADADSIAGRQRFERALARFDAANAVDPRRETADGKEWPKELLYAERMSAMVARFVPDASEALRLAARCQHIERWKISRTDYPMTRTGYLQWRKHLNERHARIAANILRDIGYDERIVGRVGSLLKKEALKTDVDAQALEDVVGLVFLESYLEAFVARNTYDEAKLTGILRKTANKMSPRGLEAALTLARLPVRLLPTIRNAVAAVGAG